MRIGDAFVPYIDDRVALVILNDDLADVSGDAAKGGDVLLIAVMFDRPTGQNREAAAVFEFLVYRFQKLRRLGEWEMFFADFMRRQRLGHDGSQGAIDLVHHLVG